MEGNFWDLDYLVVVKTNNVFTYNSFAKNHWLRYNNWTERSFQPLLQIHIPPLHRKRCRGNDSFSIKRRENKNVKWTLRFKRNNLPPIDRLVNERKTYFERNWYFPSPDSLNELSFYIFFRFYICALYFRLTTILIAMSIKILIFHFRD